MEHNWGYLKKYDFSNCVRVCISSNIYRFIPRFYFVPLNGNPESDMKWLEYIDEIYESPYFGGALSKMQKSITQIISKGNYKLPYFGVSGYLEKNELTTRIINERNRVYDGFTNLSDFEKTYIVEHNLDPKSNWDAKYFSHPVLDGNKQVCHGQFGESPEITKYIKGVLFARKNTCFSVKDAIAYKAKINTPVEELYL